MKPVCETLQLTHDGTMHMLGAAINKANELAQPQCIVIVDASGEILASLRMTGAKYLSMRSARAKARTAASIGVETNKIPPQVGPAIAAATGGHITRLGGGMPIYMHRILVGGIGVGSGSSDQDRAVALAALSAIGASADL